MSEPAKPCIRGCVRDCRCEACAVAPAPVHDPIPAPATDGWLCGACSSRLRRWLGSVLDDTLRLSTHIPDNYGWDHGHTHAKVSGSPALIRLEVAALIDPRSEPTVQEQDSDYEENQSDMGRAIPYTVCSWARLFAEEHNLSSPVDTMNGAVTLLINWWDTLVQCLWVDEFYQDLALIRQWLNAAHGWRPPTLVGDCFECGGELRKSDGDGTDEAKCHGCRRVYDGSDLFKVRLQKNHDRIDELTATARITPELAREFLRLKYPQHPTPRESTIRSWLTRGNVTTTAAGGIDIKSMEHWFITLRNQKQAQRRGKAAV